MSKLTVYRVMAGAGGARRVVSVFFNKARLEEELEWARREYPGWFIQWEEEEDHE